MKLTLFFSRRISDLVSLFLIAVFLYVPFFISLRSLSHEQARMGVDSRFTLPVYGSDSVGYVVLADNLITQHVFSSDSSSPFSPDTFRTPVYPLMLAFWKIFFGSFVWFPLLQLFFTIGASFLILKIGEKVFGRGVGMTAAFLYLIDPTVLFHTAVLMSDTPFVFFILLSLYTLFFLPDRFPEKRMYLFCLSGFLMGFSVVLRPIAMFLPFVLVPFLIWFFYKKETRKRLILGVVLFIIGCGVCVLPWMIRNKSVAGSWGISSVSSFNLFHYYVPEFLGYKQGVNPDVIRLQMQKELPAGISPADAASVSNSATLNSISLRYLHGNIFSYAKFHLVKTLPVFLSSGIKSALVSYNSIVGYPVYSTSNANLTTFILHGEAKSFFVELWKFPITTLEMLFLAGILGLSFLSLFCKKERFFILLFWALILYFSLLTGSVAYSRFRLPVAPFLFLLATFSATIVWRLASSYVKRKRNTL
jgi:4-amino-4-deoxy-L-arabinose transferase-like glycosyltransferase